MRMLDGVGTPLTDVRTPRMVLPESTLQMPLPGTTQLFVDPKRSF